MAKPIVDEFPYPFELAMAQELVRVMAGAYRTEREALGLVQQFGVDPLAVTPNLSTLNLWHELLEKTAIAGTTRPLVAAVRKAIPNNPRAPFLDALLADKSAAVSAEPVSDHGPAFLSGTDDVKEPEALLFFDDLTMPTGRVPAFIETLNRVLASVPAVCLLRVRNVVGEYFGTGFRIGPDLLLTNEHVLVPNKQPAVKVQADFGFDVDGTGASLAVVSLAGDPATVVAERADDWAVVRVAGMDAAWPIMDLTAAPAPKNGDPAYILQHPGGQQKRIGFVRNTISAVDDRVVHYLTDTQPGSSGAPVFDAAGRLIALHHAGGRPVEVAGKPPVSKNEGIRISRVLAGLKARNVFS